MMKKLLFYFTVMHCISLQAINKIDHLKQSKFRFQIGTKFNHLNQLKNHSRIKHNCERLQSNWIFPDEKKTACYCLDQLTTVMIIQTYNILIDHPKQEQFKTLVQDNLSKTLFSDDYMRDLITTIVPQAKTDAVLLAYESDCLASLIMKETTAFLDSADNK